MTNSFSQPPASCAAGRPGLLRALGLCLALVTLANIGASTANAAGLAVRAEVLHTLAGPALTNGVVLIRDGKIQSAGHADRLPIPDGYRAMSARVVTPGLIDARTVVGLSGMLNQPHDQEQLEKSAPSQPELRAIDAYNSRDPLIDWLRGFGITTLHTGHGPGALVSGQTMIVKTAPHDLSRAVVVSNAMLAASLGPDATNPKGPGTAAKAVALLRADLIKAREYSRKRAKAMPDDPPARDLRLESFIEVLERRQPLLVTAQRHQDILAALRLAAEFSLPIVLDGAADAPLVLPAIKASGFPVLLHPTMSRPEAQTENLGLDTAARLRQAGIPFAFQSGFENYVPKTRVVLLEAAMAAANGLTFEQALAAITLDAARILGVQQRLGSLEPGKDADLALFDGDPFEFTTHGIGVVIDGEPIAGPVR